MTAKRSLFWLVPKDSSPNFVADISIEERRHPDKIESKEHWSSDRLKLWTAGTCRHCVSFNLLPSAEYWEDRDISDSHPCACHLKAGLHEWTTARPSRLSAGQATACVEHCRPYCVTYPPAGSYHTRTLHWLPVKYRMQFKLLTLTYKAMYNEGHAHTIQPTKDTSYREPVAAGGALFHLFFATFRRLMPSRNN